MAATIVDNNAAFEITRVNRFSPSRPIRNVGGIVELLCTCAADGTLSVALSTEIMAKLAGWYIQKLKSRPGGVPPTDASGLEITDPEGLSVLGGNGTDFIDSTSAQSTLCFNTFLGVNEYYMPVVSEPLTITVTGNIVDSATFYLTFYLAQ